jgi:hypothetical protein
MFGPWFEPAADLPDVLKIGNMELSAHVTQAPVPIPGSMVLLLSGFGALIVSRRISRT